MSSFYKECQRIYEDRTKEHYHFLDYISDHSLFRNATENLQLDVTLDTDINDISTAFQSKLESRIVDLQNAGFAVNRDDDGYLEISAVSATYGFALECKLAFEQAEQQVIDRLLHDLPEITESDFLEKANEGENKIRIPLFVKSLTSRIEKSIRGKYKFWTDQGFKVYVQANYIQLSFKEKNKEV